MANKTTLMAMRTSVNAAFA
jgi:hypothetical protein